MDEQYIYNLNYHLCLRCGKKFKHRGLLNRHLKNKNPCNINYVKVTREDLIDDYYKVYFKNIDIVKHKILKSSINTINAGNKCEFCGKTTKTTRGLNQHIQKYCVKREKLEHRYGNVITSAKKLLSDYSNFVKGYKSVKNGTNIVNHPSVVGMVNNAHVFKALNKLIAESTPVNSLNKKIDED